MKKTNRFKVFASFMLILSMVFTLAPSLSMAASDDIKIIVNGEQIKMDVKPFIRNGRTFVPIRFVSEALDGEVDWDSVTKKIVIKKAGKEINIWIGLVKSVIGSIVKNDLDESPILKDGRTFVPLRFVAENLDCTVDWNSSTRTVIIKAKDYVEKESVINTIDSLGLKRYKISDYPVLSKSDFQFKYFDSETKTLSMKKDVVFITPNDLPFQFADTIIYSFDIKGDTCTMEQQRLKGDNSAIWIDLAVTNEGIRRTRNDNYKHPTIDLGNGRILATYDEVALSDSLKFNNYESFKWEQVEYFILYSDEIPELIAIKNPLR